MIEMNASSPTTDPAKSPGRPIRLNLRADSSESIGSGHVARLVPVANHAIKRGLVVRVLSRQLTPESQALLEENGIAWTPLTANNRSQGEIPLDNLDIKSDAAGVIRLVDEQFDELLISDSYEVSDEWFEEVRSCFSVTAAIVDGNIELKSPDFIFDLTLWPRNTGDSTDPSISPQGNARTFSGNPFFQLTAQNYVHSQMFHPKDPSKDGLEILLFNGLGDTRVVTTRILQAITELKKTTRIKVHLVTTPSLANLLVELGFESHLNLKVMHSLKSSEFFNLCRNANLVIGSPGVSSVERAKQGIPQVLFSLADNQLELGAKLERLGVAAYGGDARTLDARQIADYLDTYITENLSMFDSELGPLLFDFNGAARILELIAPSDISSTNVREATLADGPTLFLWSNDDVTRSQSLNTAQITPLEHRQWLKTVLANDSSTSVYIFNCDGVPAGQVKFNRGESLGEYKIGYSLDPAFRSKGLAKLALAQAINAHSTQQHVDLYVAEVRSSNKASLRALESAGFAPDADLGGGVLRMILKKCP